MRDLTTEHGRIKHIVFCEKQAQFHCVEGSPQHRDWQRRAKEIRQQIGEARPWYELQSIYNLRGVV